MYFKLTTNITNAKGNKRTFDFGKQCNYVDFSGDKFCRFAHNNDNGSMCLMLIPYSNIAYIEQFEEGKAGE